MVLNNMISFNMLCLKRHHNFRDYIFSYQNFMFKNKAL
jgi:hypothetical protein